nr:Increased rDNA silencing protein [Ipomoea batatas]
MAAGCHQLAGILLSVALALASLNLSACYVFKGSVTCLDCTHTHSHPADLSGVKLSVKCGGEKNMAMTTTTEEDGSFETTVVLPSSKSPSSVSCSAKILGATRQLYIPMKACESKVVVRVAGESDHNHYMTTSEPLRFYTKCPNAKCGGVGIGGSKTVDLPLPREWGLPPTSYYSLPFFPIIGIP